MKSRIFRLEKPPEGSEGQECAGDRERVEALSRLGPEVPGIKRFWKNASMKGRMRCGEQEGETVRRAGPRLRGGVVKTRLRNLGPPGLPFDHGHCSSLSVNP